MLLADWSAGRQLSGNLYYSGLKAAVFDSFLPKSKLPNRIRASRKKAGLTQEELAFLLGCKCGTLVSRYEVFLRQAPLTTAIALEAIFSKPMRELFPRLHEQVDRETAERATQLMKRLSARAGDARIARKVAVLARLAHAGRGDDHDDHL